MTDNETGAETTNGHEPPLSLPQAAAFLNVTDRWLRRAVSQRRLPYLKVGGHVRFLAADLRAYLTSTRVVPVTTPEEILRPPIPLRRQTTSKRVGPQRGT